MDFTRDDATDDVPAKPAAPAAPAAPRFAPPPTNQLSYAVATWLQRVDAAAGGRQHVDQPVLGLLGIVVERRRAQLGLGVRCGIYTLQPGRHSVRQLIRGRRRARWGRCWSSRGGRIRISLSNVW